MNADGMYKSENHQPRKSMSMYDEGSDDTGGPKLYAVVVENVVVVVDLRRYQQESLLTPP